MNIFESLENLEVSEACFDEIMGIVEGNLEAFKKLADNPDNKVNPVFFPKKEGESIKDTEKRAQEFIKIKNSPNGGEITNTRQIEPKKRIKEALDEIFDILEQYINEVSVGLWTDAAKSSLPKREFKEDTAYEKLFKRGEGEVDKASENRRYAQKISDLGDLIDNKGGSTLKYQANANDFIKKLNRAQRKIADKETKRYLMGGNFPERKEIRKEVQRDISSGGRTGQELSTNDAKKEKYSHYISPVKKHSK